jgi:hypothetical protein
MEHVEVRHYDEAMAHMECTHEMRFRIGEFPYRPPRAESTSPGAAWRPSSFLEKIFFPPTVTSNTPPEDGIRRSPVTASPLALRISSATRTA